MVCLEVIWNHGIAVPPHCKPLQLAPTESAHQFLHFLAEVLAIFLSQRGSSGMTLGLIHNEATHLPASAVCTLFAAVRCVGQAGAHAGDGP